MGSRLRLLCALEWRYQSLPVFDGDDWSFSTVAVTFGITYDIAPRP